ncbi:MAG: DUF5320 domain-containing protein [Bacteriovoracaceae bacterium]|nr:DUF5320 domain-containing protein [Bacteriovoracaceae bacterium]
MPGRNGTGPMGAGPRTGGGFGYCTGDGRRSFGRGRGGGGRGFGQRSWAQQPAIEDEKTFLKNEIKSLEEQLLEVKNELENIDKKE